MKYAFILILLIIGCSGNYQNKDEEKNKSISQAKTKPEHNIIEIPKNAIFFDSIKFNGAIKLKGEEENLIRSLGKPDSSIIEDGWDCGNYLNDSTSILIYYYGHTRFLIADGKYLLHRLSFSEKLTSFAIGRHLLNEETEIKEFLRLYPGAYTKALSEMNKTEVHIEMTQHPQYEDSSSFIFTFTQGKLLNIELWWFIC